MIMHAGTVSSFARNPEPVAASSRWMLSCDGSRAPNVPHISSSTASKRAPDRVMRIFPLKSGIARSSVESTSCSSLGDG